MTEAFIKEYLVSTAIFNPKGKYLSEDVDFIVTFKLSDGSTTDVLFTDIRVPAVQVGGKGLTFDASYNYNGIDYSFPVNVVATR